MKILLDTNIIIDRETNYVRNKDIGILFNWLDRLKYEKCIHPLTSKEIENHKDPTVVKTFKVKLTSYSILRTEAPPSPEVTKISQIMDKSTNDFNDTKLINELVNKRVDFIITEDKKLHDKARLLNVDNRVFTISSFLEKVISENPDLVDYKTLSAKKDYFGNINLKDPFFDSFRTDYVEFDNWFNRKSEETAYVCLESDKTLAFLYVKPENRDENYTDIFPTFAPKKRLKIGTFKVSLNGYKLGERFLKIVFDNAIKQNVEEIYVTIFNKSQDHQRLIDLLSEWGFYYWGIKKSVSGEEQVYVRDFSKRFNQSNPKSTFPHISQKTNIFLVPIYPDYHTNLFPDSILNTESPESFIENEPFRNALSKVYISRSFERKLMCGDILVFYRTGGYYESVVTTIGIVESTKDNIKDESELITLCRKRSVFTDKELVAQWNYSNTSKPFIVNFLYTYSFPKRINLKKLIELGIIPTIHDAPRGFKKISSEDFNKIITHTHTDINILV